MKTTESTETFEYDDDGRIVRRIVTTKTIEDEVPSYIPNAYPQPWQPQIWNGVLPPTTNSWWDPDIQVGGASA